MKIELLISQPNNSNDIFNSKIYMNDFNNARIYKLFSSKPKQMLTQIYAKIRTHSLQGYLKYIRYRCLETYLQ